jgi:hypothetical protein
LPTFIVTSAPVGVTEVGSPKFKMWFTADELLDTRRRAGDFARLLCIENDGDEPIELAHVRNGILYEGLSSQVDWADLAQVIDVWERAKDEVLNRLVVEQGGTKGFGSIVDDVIESMGLPKQWLGHLQRAVIKMNPEIESSLVF